MALRYYIDCEGFRFSDRRRVTAWLTSCAQREGYAVGEVNVIFTSSEKLLDINRQFLEHDYFTDIITFDDSDLDAGVISGELYIDVETVADNAQQLDVMPLRELHRVIVHGILHLCAQGDKSEAEAAVMRAKESAALALLDQSIS